MSALTMRRARTSTMDVRGMGVLSLGHVCADLCQGSVPALLPTLIVRDGLSLGAATALVSIASIGSSVVQPIFGIWSDRISAPLLAPLGVLLGALGLGAVGLTHSYLALALALAVSGLGVALFHPEGARMAGLVAGGQARGMSYFSLGGNVGFALGPALVLLVVGVGGLSASPFLALPGVLVAALMAVEVRRLHDRLPRPGSHRHADAPPAPAQWGPFARLSGAAVARTVVFFALQAFIPIYLIGHFGRSHTVASLVLIAVLVAGAIGTIVGGRMADRVGRRRMIAGAGVALTALLLVLPHTGVAGFVAIVVLIGFAADGPFATTVVLGQEYLPGRGGLASGITLGLAIGIGGLLAAAVGAFADATSMHAALMLLPVFSISALGLALSLPRDAALRRLRPQLSVD
jgi:MFS transporter, FSR family, fosmidomycin resistance protein